MSDLISRQAAIETSLEFFVEFLGGAFHENGQKELMARFQRLQSADRPIGEWVDNGDRYYRCSLCGTKDTDTWDWCHGCGCRMKGADDDR